MAGVIKVYIVMTTYDRGDGVRTKVATESAESIAKNLSYPNLHWIISDDGTTQHAAHVGSIKDGILRHTPDVPIDVVNVERRGVGASKNTSLRKVFEETPIVLLTEDDWVLTKPLELLPYVQLLLDHATVGMVRLGYLGGEMSAKLTAYSGITFWELIQNSGLYVYSGQISLRHQRFYDVVGFHNEALSAGEEELDMCHRYNALNEGKSAPFIIWPTWNCSLLNCGIFVNNGLSSSLNNILPE